MNLNSARVEGFTRFRCTIFSLPAEGDHLFVAGLSALPCLVPHNRSHQAAPDKTPQISFTEGRASRIWMIRPSGFSDKGSRVPASDTCGIKR